MAKREIIIPKGMENQYEEWAIAPGYRVGDTLYCSGQIGFARDGSLPSDPETQYSNAFEQVGAILAEAGGNFADLVEVSTFHIGLVEHMDLFSKVRARYLSKPYPAETAVGVAELGIPGALLEIRATAVLG
jgi:enamine deaminase RidA (YjgF/YER057c/UK114 family)